MALTWPITVYLQMLKREKEKRIAEILIEDAEIIALNTNHNED